jgi:hypothetical protein
MKILPLFAAAAFGLALSGCSNQYYERKETVTFNAGEAVAWNIAQQTPDPWPKGVNNTHIVADGERAARAVRRYKDGKYKWLRGGSDTGPIETIVAPGASTAGSGAPAGGAGAPVAPGQ